MMIRIGLVGAGKAAQQHAAAIPRIPDARLVAVADLDVERGSALAERHDARYVLEARDLVGLDLEVVIVAVPHAFLARTAIAALGARKHVLVEKPMAITRQEADAVLTAARDADLVLQVGYVHRFRPSLQAAWRLIAEGRIGRPTLVVEDHNMSDDRVVGPWVWDPAVNGGGILLYSGIHGLDRLRWLTGQEVALAFAQMGRFAHASGMDDNAAVTLRLSGGCLAAVNQNFTPFPIPNRWQTQVYGTDGVLRIGHGTLELFDYSGQQPIELETGDHFEAQLRAFLAAVRNEHPPAVPGTEGHANLVAMLAIYESARTGRPVQLAAASSSASWGALPVAPVRREHPSGEV